MTLAKILALLATAAFAAPALVVAQTPSGAPAPPAYRPGRMSTLEKPLHHYLVGYLDRVLGDGRKARAGHERC